MSHSKSLFLRPHLPDECMNVLDCVFFSSNELRNLACGNGGKKGSAVLVCLCIWFGVCGCVWRELSVCVLNYIPVVCHESFH